MATTESDALFACTCGLAFGTQMQRVAHWQNCDGDAVAVPRSVLERLETLSASEALYGFVGWLTSGDSTYTAGRHYDAGRWAELVQEFCEANELPEPRDGWVRNLVNPKRGPCPVEGCALNEKHTGYHTDADGWHFLPSKWP